MLPFESSDMFILDHSILVFGCPPICSNYNSRKLTKVHSFLNQCCAQSLVDSKQSTSVVVSLIGFVKVPCFESTEDRANTVLSMNGLQHMR